MAGARQARSARPPPPRRAPWRDIPAAPQRARTLIDSSGCGSRRARPRRDAIPARHGHALSGSGARRRRSLRARREFFANARQLDSTYLSPLARLVDVAGYEGNLAKLRRYGNVYLARDSAGPPRTSFAGASPPARMTRPGCARFAPASIRSICHAEANHDASQAGTVALDDADRAAALVVARSTIRWPGGAVRGELTCAQPRPPAAGGQPPARASKDSQSTATYWQSVTLGALFGEATASVAARPRGLRKPARAPRVRRPRAVALTRSLRRLARGAVAGPLGFDRGDTAAAAAAVRSSVRGDAAWLADVVEMLLATDGGAPDAPMLRARVDSVAAGVLWWRPRPSVSTSTCSPAPTSSRVTTRARSARCIDSATSTSRPAHSHTKATSRSGSGTTRARSAPSSAISFFAPIPSRRCAPSATASASGRTLAGQPIAALEAVAQRELQLIAGLGVLQVARVAGSNVKIGCGAGPVSAPRTAESTGWAPRRVPTTCSSRLRTLNTSSCTRRGVSANRRQRLPHRQVRGVHPRAATTVARHDAASLPTEARRAVDELLERRALRRAESRPANASPTDWSRRAARRSDRRRSFRRRSDRP